MKETTMLFLLLTLLSFTGNIFSVTHHLNIDNMLNLELTTIVDNDIYIILNTTERRTGSNIKKLLNFCRANRFSRTEYSMLFDILNRLPELNDTDVDLEIAKIVKCELDYNSDGHICLLRERRAHINDFFLKRLSKGKTYREFMAILSSSGIIEPDGESPPLYIQLIELNNSTPVSYNFDIDANAKTFKACIRTITRSQLKVKNSCRSKSSRPTINNS